MTAAANQGSARWTERSVSAQTGRVAVVTGANTGIGFETARVLAQRGATVVLAGRTSARMQAAQRRLTRRGVDEAALGTVQLDLASLASVRRATDELRERYPRIDLLINNAGVMDTPYALTEDGFERQFGTNHLGHFALTGLLLPSLLEVAGSRIVNVSSLAHRRGAMDFTDLGFARDYKPDTAYCRSKLANMLFTFALQRRLAASGVSTITLAVHPGIARTELNRNESVPLRVLLKLLGPFVMQGAARGALPSLRAATDAAAVGGQFYGPDGRAEWRGHPVPVEPSETACDEETQERLWSESEQMTGVTFSFAR